MIAKTARPYRSPMDNEKNSPDPCYEIQLENKHLHDRLRIYKE